MNNEYFNQHIDLSLSSNLSILKNGHFNFSDRQDSKKKHNLMFKLFGKKKRNNSNNSNYTKNENNSSSKYFKIKNENENSNNLVRR